MKISVNDLFRMPYLAALNIESGGRKSFSGISTDTRTMKAGNVFFAIRGEQFDGHAFVDTAVEKGAACIVVDEQVDRHRIQSKPALIVKDTAKAFGTLANIWRQKFDIPFIAVAGSNGKTTTKEMIATVLGTTYRVLSTKGNLNNHIGVPQTLFRLTRNHDAAVVEVGTNHFGEIAYLSDILAPTHGIITNIGREHLQFFGDVEGVAKAEGELFVGLGKKGIGFVNTDDLRIVRQSKRLKKRVTYGFTKSSNAVRGKLLRMTNKGCAEFSVKPKNKKAFSIELSVPGKHAMMNALAAATVGLSLGVSPKNIQKALQQFTAVGKRMEVLTVAGVTILNDTYNANPDSVISALETLAAVNSKGKKIVVLADMLELGDVSREEHIRVGETVGRMGFGYLLTFGEMAKYINEGAQMAMNIHYDQKNVLSEYAAELLSPGDVILIKGSRGMKMEDVVEFIVDQLGKKAA